MKELKGACKALSRCQGAADDGDANVAKREEEQVTEEDDDDDDDEEEGEGEGDDEDEEDLSVWHTEGNEYLGQRVRRYAYDETGQLVDAWNGTIKFWLPVDKADYLDQETNEPAALWKLVYDDPRLGREDLDEAEVKESIRLYTEEVPKEIQKKVMKRQGRILEMRLEKWNAEGLVGPVSKDCVRS